MSTTSHATLDLRRLRLELAGEVIGPDDAAYETARTVFLPTVDRRPAAIVRPVDDAAVAAVVELARETGLELAVRGGGHSMAGHGRPKAVSCSTSHGSTASRSTPTRASPPRPPARPPGR